MKKHYPLLLTALLICYFGNSQTIFVDSFSNGGGNWAFDAPNTDGWIVNNTYSCSTNTPNQGGGNYMHVYDDLDGEYCDYALMNLAGSANTIYATMTNNLSTVGYSSVTINFDWLCNGSTTFGTWGTFSYSIDNGSNWVLITSPVSHYVNTTAWTSATITSTNVPALLNQAIIKFRFGWINAGIGNNPAMAVDNFKITGTTSSCTNVGGSAALTSSLICQNETGDITLTGSTGTIQWQQSTDGSTFTNVGGGSGATTASYTTAQLGGKTYFRAVLSQATCPDAYSNTVVVNIDTPVVAISPANPIVCPGETTTLTATGNGTTYTWCNLATTNSITAGSGACSVTVTDNNSCSASASTFVSQYPVGTVNVSTHGDTLSAVASNAVSYLWYRDSIALANGMVQDYVVVVSGHYYVVVTDNNGCTASSSVYNIIITGTGSVNNNINASLYPNPNNGSFTLAFNDDIEKEIEITDATGRIILPVNKITRNKNIELNTAPGIYFMRIKQGENVNTVKFSLVK